MLCFAAGACAHGYFHAQVGAAQSQCIESRTSSVLGFHVSYSFLYNARASFLSSSTSSWYNAVQDRGLRATTQTTSLVPTSGSYSQSKRLQDDVQTPQVPRKPRSLALWNADRVMELSGFPGQLPQAGAVLACLGWSGATKATGESSGKSAVLASADLWDVDWVVRHLEYKSACDHMSDNSRRRVSGE